MKRRDGGWKVLIIRCTKSKHRRCQTSDRRTGRRGWKRVGGCFFVGVLCWFWSPSTDKLVFRREERACAQRVALTVFPSTLIEQAIFHRDVNYFPQFRRPRERERETLWQIISLNSINISSTVCIAGPTRFKNYFETIFIWYFKLWIKYSEYKWLCREAMN